MTTHNPLGGRRYEVEEYDEWVVQRRPHDVQDKHYDEYQWTTVNTGLSYEEAKEKAEQETEGVGGLPHYIFRAMPAEEV